LSSQFCNNFLACQKINGNLTQKCEAKFPPFLNKREKAVQQNIQTFGIALTVWSSGIATTCGVMGRKIESLRDVGW
jgi:hypothetical protein